MSVIRVQKSKNFTTMSNIHLRDKELSLKAKGLMSVMLSLPDDWNYSVAGLCAICKEKETSVKNTLNELRDRRYVIVERIEPSKETGGRIQYEYFVYEQPQGDENKKVDVKESYKAKQEQKKQPLEKQGSENLWVENLAVENIGGLLNTNIPSTDKSNTYEVNTKGLKTDNKYALEDVKRPSSKGNMYASVPEEHKDVPPKKQSRYIPPDYTEEQLIEHIRPTIEENLKTVQEDCEMEYNPKCADDIVEIVTDFFEQYREKTGRRHKILPDATLINIMYKYFNPPECLWDRNDPPTYSAMIEKYLDANFNARGGYDGEVTLSISHFMSGKIRENCYQRIK